MLYSLVLAGGKGTRLYPLSRSVEPKQFLTVVNGKSFLANTVDRVRPIIPKENTSAINRSCCDSSGFYSINMNVKNDKSLRLIR